MVLAGCSRDEALHVSKYVMETHHPNQPSPKTKTHVHLPSQRVFVPIIYNVRGCDTAIHYVLLRLG